jgi:hypothetical protein
MAKRKDSRTGARIRLTAPVEHELASACLEGLSAKAAQLRLVRCGVVLSERTVARRMSEWRAAQHKNEYLHQLGIGIGSVHADIAAAAATMQTAAPEWREHAITALRSSFDQFVGAPTSERFTAVVVQSYGLLISTSLQTLFEGKDA